MSRHVIIYKLDLHGVRYESVVPLFHKFINRWWGNDMLVITGNSPRMKEIVCQILESYDVEYVVGGITGNEPHIKILGG